jgi:hypothetical protein
MHAAAVVTSRFLHFASRRHQYLTVVTPAPITARMSRLTRVRSAKPRVLARLCRCYRIGPTSPATQALPALGHVDRRLARERTLAM